MRNILIAVPSKKEKLPLSVTHPELAKEADGWDASQVSAGSNKKLNWKCSSQHRWSAIVASRALNSSGCPFCSGRIVMPGLNDLKTLYPMLALEADGWDPSFVLPGSGKKLKWKCDQGHSWLAPPVNRKRGTGCKICSKKKVIPGKNDLLTRFPMLGLEADGWDPSYVMPGTHQKLKWKCNKGHKWEASPNSRTHLDQPTGCPVCSGRNVLTGFNDLKTLFPDTASQADNWDPSLVLAHSGTRRKWKCKLGHIWSNSPNVQIRANGRCPYCSGAKVWTGYNDLATTNPELALQLVGEDPTKIGSGSSKRYLWQCSNGHQWKTSPSQRKSGRDCPFCSGKYILVGFNDLKTTHPSIAKELVELDATSISKGSNRRVTWRCSLGHEWVSSANQRTSGYGCPYCSGRSVWPGFNDLATTHPILARELVDLDGTTINQGSVKKVWWKCASGHKWLATPNNRVGSQSGCPTCFVPGFDPNKSAFLYLIEHSRWEMFQVGITNFPDDRLGSHKRLGWKLLELRGPMDGHLTQKWETAILRMLKSNGADLSNKNIAGKFDGYSEAWSKSTFQVSSIKEMMRLTEEFEEKLKDAT